MEAITQGIRLVNANSPAKKATAKFFPRTRAKMHDWIGAKLRYENGGLGEIGIKHLKKAALLAPTPNRWIKCGQAAELSDSWKDGVPLHAKEISGYYDLSRDAGTASYEDLHFRANAYYRIGEYEKAVVDFDALMLIKFEEMEKSMDPLHLVYVLQLRRICQAIETGDAERRETSRDALRKILKNIEGISFNEEIRRLHMSIVDITRSRINARIMTHKPDERPKAEIETKILEAMENLAE